MTLNGTVIMTPRMVNNNCIFRVKCGEENIDIISRGYQAVKDNIFLEEGCYIEMQGKMIDDIFYTNSNKINIMKYFKAMEEEKIYGC